MATSEQQMIGPYRILEPLGQGGMATVFKAYHPKLDRIVAIKMIHQNFLDDEGFVSRFEREAQIVARLEHPNIVPVYDYAEHNGMPYLVMKYVEGSTLKYVLNEGALLFADVMTVMNAIASALDYAHSKGILHRDIKPSNIMLDMQATPYLADFGLARIVKGGASTMSMDMLIGTPYYMSPEQARGDVDLDARTDVYSFGIVLYELLTGTVPYQGATPYSIIHQHITAELPPAREINPGIPPQVDSVISRALAKQRDDRYESAGSLMSALTSALTSGAAANPRTAPGASMQAAALPGSQPLTDSVVSASKRQRRTIVTPGLSAAATPTASSAARGVSAAQPASSLPVIPSAKPPAAQARPKAQPRKRQAGLIWWLGGIAALLVIGVLALGALSRLRAGAGAVVPTLASLSSPTAAALSAGGRPTLPPTWTPTGAPPAPDGQRPADGGQAGSPPGDGSPPLLVAPDLSLVDAQAGVAANPDDEIAHLALFRAQLEAGQTDALVGTLEAGLLAAENRARFLLSAAQTANDMGSNAVAVAILRDGLTRLQSDPSYLLLRSEGGAALYSAALHPGSIDIFDLRDFTDVATISRTDVSPIYSAIMARALLTGGNERLAGLVVEAALRRDQRMPEGQLVLGEVKAALGDTQEALTTWQALAAQQQMPSWVRTRLDELMG